MVRALEVSRSGYNEWRKNLRNPSSLKEFQAWLDEQVLRIFDQNQRRYGAPKITKQLNNEGHIVNRKTVAKRLIRQTLELRQPRNIGRQLTRTISYR